MGVPTISGTIKRPDNTAFVGEFTIYRVTGPMFNQNDLVALCPIRINTASDGSFSTELHPGQYVAEASLSKYQWPPFTRFKFRVPNNDNEIAFSDLARETGLPDPSYFGGDTGGDGTTPTATTTTQGKVKIAETDSDPVVPTLKTFVGTDTQSSVFCPLSGELYIYVPEDSSYHRLLGTKQGGQVLPFLDQTPVAFASLPA